MRLINYGSKIMDHTFILKGLKGGTICVFFGYRLTRRPERVVNFCDCILRCCARHAGTVGWGGVPWHLHANMMVHGVRSGGVGLITLLGTSTPT